MFPDDADDMDGRVFGDRYRVVGAIGRGTASSVYRADDLVEGRCIALKVFDQAVGEDPDRADRIVARIAAAASIEHPNVVVPLDWGIDGVRIWTVSELCEGGSLGALLRLGRALSPSQTLVMSLEIARGLGHAHSRGLVHRAITPNNVLFSADQRLRLSDFGLRDVLAEVPLARPSETIDLVRYMSPEQAAGRSVDSQSDIYSLALVASEAVSGAPPVAADTATATMLSRAESSAELSSELAQLRGPLERAGRRDPDERPDAEELTISLLAVAETMPRPGPIELAGVPGRTFDLEPSDNDHVELDEHATSDPDGTVPEIATEILLPEASGTARSDEPDQMSAALAVVPPADEAPERVGLEDLDQVEPVFADTTAVDDTFDVPDGAPLSSSRSFRPEADDLDDDLPMWPLAALTMLVALAVGAIFLLSGRSEGVARVPDLVGLDSTQVEAALADGGWEVQRLEARQNGTTVGRVIGQSPPPGSELDVDDDVEVTISLGSEMVEIPDDLAGLSLDQATERLRVSGLDVGAITRESSETLAEGSVIGLAEPTRQKPEGESVALRVSTGPEDRIVPDTLIGTSIADATATLAGLRLQGREEQVYDPVAAPGTVLASDPPAGEEVPADSAVTLLVSAGPEPVEMPELAELTLAEAVDAIEALGLIFADTEGTPGEPVIATIPPAGEIVDVATEVIIVLADPDEDDDDEESTGDDSG